MKIKGNRDISEKNKGLNTMEDEKLLTVMQFAKLTSKSRQAVYQQMSTCLSKYVKIRQGRKYIEIRALKELYNMDVDKALLSMVSVKSSQVCVKSDKDKFVRENEELKEQVKVLTDKLNEKEIQLAGLLARLEEKEKLIDTLQADKTSLNEKFDKLLEDNADTVTALKQLSLTNSKLEYQIQAYQHTEPEQKKGFFARIFGKGK